MAHYIGPLGGVVTTDVMSGSTIRAALVYAQYRRTLC